MKNFAKVLNKKTISLSVIAAAVIMSGCSNDDPIVDSNVAVQFAAQVNGADFACGQTYTGIGTAPSDMTFSDFRVYVNSFYINDEGGNRYDMTLTQDGQWQQDEVALLDFEDASNGCTGTTEMNSQVAGTVTAPASTDLSNVEVCFTVGVPEDKNHIEFTTATAPLNSVDMQWQWRDGYKFIKIDGVGDPAGTPNAFNLHLGSQGCPGAVPLQAPTGSCTEPNTFEVCVANFDLENSVISVDPAFVYEANDVSVNLSVSVPMNPAAPKPGCQSFIDDDDCEEIMPRLGLNYDYGRSGTGVASTYAGEQRLFSKQ